MDSRSESCVEKWYALSTGIFHIDPWLSSRRVAWAGYLAEVTGHHQGGCAE